MVIKQEIHSLFSFFAVFLEAKLKITCSSLRMHWPPKAVAPTSLVASSQAQSSWKARALLPEMLKSHSKVWQNAATHAARDFHTFCFPIYCSLVFRSAVCPLGCSDCIQACYWSSSSCTFWWSSSILLLHLGACLKSTPSFQSAGPKDLYCLGGTQNLPQWPESFLTSVLPLYLQLCLTKFFCNEHKNTWIIAMTCSDCTHTNISQHYFVPLSKTNCGRML